MSCNLTQFLLEMGSAIQKAEEFKSNPDAVMDRYGLSDDEKSAVKAGDRARLGELIPEDDDLHRNVEVNLI